MTHTATQPLSFRTIAEPTAKGAEITPHLPVVIDAMTGPTPEQVDQLIVAYEAADRVATAAGTVLKERKETLLSLINLFGHASPQSESSRQIAGLLNKAVATKAHALTLNEDRIAELRLLLTEDRENSHIDFFLRLFNPRVRHELAEGAEDTIKTAALPKRLMTKVLSVYGQCVTVKRKAPSLRVELLHKEPKPARTQAKKAGVQA